MMEIWAGTNRPPAEWTLTPDHFLHSRRLALALVALALSVAFLSAIQLDFNWTSHGVGVPFARIFAYEAVEWLLWAAAVPLSSAVDGAVKEGRREVMVASHLALFLTFFGLDNGVMTGFPPLVPADAVEGGFVTRFVTRATQKLPAGAFVYGLIVIAVRWLATTREYHRETLRRARLESELAEARLEALRMQIHPHFLFNTFNAVSGLVREGHSTAATATLAHLGELLRQSLRIEEKVIPLREELDLLEHYLAIQRIRFSDCLEARVDLSAEAADALVPPLLLQPLVENAVQHGIEGVREHGRVHLRATTDGSWLRITVTDNGAGPEPHIAESIGLSNTRRRLAETYGEAGRFVLRHADGGGAEAEIHIPFRSGREH